MNPPLVLLTGASGFIGSRVLEALRRTKHSVRCLVRKPLSASGAEMTVGDITDPMACCEAVKGVTAVIHTAGEKSRVSQYMAVNAEGTRNLLEAALQNGVSRFIHVSSVGVIGADPFCKRVFDEESPCHPRNDYERSKWQAELHIIQAASKGLETVILRPANVFGDNDPNLGLLNLVRTVHEGRFFFLGGRESICNFIYVDDVATAVIAALEHRKAVGKIYHLSDSCTIGVFIDFLADELGVERPSIKMPSMVVALIRKILSMSIVLPALSGSTIFSQAVSLNNQACFASTRLQQYMKFDYPVGWRLGMRRMVGWYRQRGML